MKKVLTLLSDLYQNAQDMTETLLNRKRRSDIWMGVAIVALARSLHAQPQLITASNR